ncbi:MAG: PAS domain S-box protein [Holophaga sp.]
MLERTAGAACVVSSQGEICFWNASAECLTGYAASHVLGRTCQDVLACKGALGTVVGRPGCGTYCCTAWTESVPNFDLEITTRSGQKKWVDVSTIVFDDSRLHKRFFAHLAHDISDRKEAEQAFSKMVEASRQILSMANGGARPAPVEPLSNQETRILKLFADSKTSGEIARDLKITLATLRNHLHAINRKLRTHNRLEAVLHAIKRGLI